MPLKSKKSSVKGENNSRKSKIQHVSKKDNKKEKKTIINFIKSFYDHTNEIMNREEKAICVLSISI